MNIPEKLAVHLRPPKLEGIKTALFIAPHPDDNEIGCGGTMAYLVSKGVKVYGLTVTDDRFSSDTLSHAEAVTLRQKEAIAAMNLLGVQDAGFLGFHDKTRARVEEISEAILPVIRRIRPDVVLTADPNLENEAHSDHIKVGQAVSYAVMDSGCDFFPETLDGFRHPDAFEVPMIGYYYTKKGNTVIDIAPFIEQKLAAVACHASQCPPGFLDLLRESMAYAAQGTCYEYVEKIKLLSQQHLHCFTHEMIV